MKPLHNRVVGQLDIDGEVISQQNILDADKYSEETVTKLKEAGFVSELQILQEAESLSITADQLEPFSNTLPQPLTFTKVFTHDDSLVFACGLSLNGGGETNIYRLTSESLSYMTNAVNEHVDYLPFSKGDKGYLISSNLNEDGLLKASQYIALTSGVSQELDIKHPAFKDFAYCETDTHIYTIGGRDSKNQNLKSVHSMDKSKPQDGFKFLGNTQDYRSRSSCAVYNNKIYMLGGVEIIKGSRSTIYQGQNTIEEFDLETGQSTILDITLPNVAGFYDMFSVQLDDERILIAGGCLAENAFVDTIAEFSMRYKYWRMSEQKLPARIAKGSAGIINGCVYFIGGSLDSGTPYSSILKYMPKQYPMLNPNIVVTDIVLDYQGEALQDEELNITALVFYSDGESKRIENSYDAEWTFTSKDGFLFDPIPGFKNKIIARNKGKLAAKISYQGFTSQELEIEVHSLVKIEIVGDPQLIVNQASNYNVMATYSNNRLRNVPNDDELRWTASNYKIVDFDQGLLRALASGDVAISAFYKKLSHTFPVKLIDRIVELTLNILDSRLTYRKEQTLEFEVIGMAEGGASQDITDSRGVTFEIVTQGLLEETSDKNIFKLADTGEATLMARYENIFIAKTFTILPNIISVSITAPIRMNKGDRYILQIYASYSDGTVDNLTDPSVLTFTSSNESAISINALGQIVAENVGVSDIEVAFEDVTDTVQITVE